jgi:hypothetical protein
LGTGTFTIASPNSNTDRTLTLPNASGTLNVSGAPNEVPAGSAAAPAIYPTGDTNTGIFFPAADTIAFAEGGAEVARFDASGQLGIGTTSPYSKLDLGPYGSQSQLSWHQDSTTSYGHIGLQNNSAAVGLLAGLKMGASANSFASSISTLWGKTAILLNYGNIQFFTNAPDTVAYGTTYTPTERARIDSSGNFLCGTTSGTTNILINNRNNDQTLYVQNTNSSAPFGMYINYPNAAPNDNGKWFFSCRDSGTNRMQIYSNGGIANFQGNNVNLSDRREKTNFAPAKSYLDTICAIPVQTFNYIDQNMEDDPGLTLGVVAQDVQEVAPELVLESNWGTVDEPKMRLSVYQTDLQYALMKALQELKADLDATKAELAALKGQA